MEQPEATNRLFVQTLEDLSDEAEIAGNVLARTAVDALYSHRRIDPEQATAIERALRAQGIAISEDEPLSEAETPRAIGTASHARALDHLLWSAKRYPFLSADEEAALGETVQRAAEVRARPERDRAEFESRVIAEGERAHATLVTSNIRLVAKVAHEPRYRLRHDLDDVVQMGLIGLMRAGEKFDPAHGVRFATYAVWWIRQGMSRGIADQGKTIRLPIHVLQRVSRYRRALRSLGLSDAASSSSVARVAEALGWTDAYAARIAQISSMNVVSLDATSRHDSDKTLSDSIADDAPNPEELLLQKDTAAQVRALVEEMEDERLREIVTRRFGLSGEPETLQQLGEDFGVTRERIRQLEEKAMALLGKRAAKARLGPLEG